MKKHKFLLSFLYSMPILCLGIAGKMLYGRPETIFELFSGKEMLGTFLLFFQYVLGTCGWGIVLAYSLGLWRFLPWLALPLGLAINAYSIAIIGAFGFLWVLNPLALIFVYWFGAGVGIYRYLQSKEVFANKHSLLRGVYSRLKARTKVFRIICFFLGLFAVLPFALSFRLYEFWDPLWYHLVGPHLWYQAGRIYFPSFHLISFNAGLWDYLYLYSFGWVSEQGGRGLIPAQIFSQWQHSLFGFAAAMPIFYVFLRTITFPRVIALLAVFAGFSIPLGFFTAFFAKNDWGTLLWIVSGLVLAFSPSEKNESQSRNRFLLSGFFLGLAFASKYTAGFLVLLLFSYLAWKNFHKKRMKNCFYLAIGISFAILPILLRNLVFTGNPLFPLFSSIFSDEWLGPTWKNNLQTLEIDNTIQNFNAYTRVLHSFREAWGQNFFYKCFWFFPIVYAFRINFSKSNRKKENFKKLFQIWGIIAGVFFIFVYKSGYYSLLRWILTTMVLMGAFGVICFTSALEYFFRNMQFLRFKQREVQKTIAIFCFLLLIFWESPLPLAMSSIRSNFTKTFSEQFAATTVGGASLWLHSNLEKGEKIAFLSETRVYYVSDLPFTRIWDSAELDRKISANREASHFFKILREEGVRYLVDTYETIDRYQREDIIHNVRIAYAERKNCYVYQDPKAIILDLECFSSNRI